MPAAAVPISPASNSGRKSLARTFLRLAVVVQEHGQIEVQIDYALAVQARDSLFGRFRCGIHALGRRGWDCDFRCFCSMFWARPNEGEETE